MEFTFANGRKVNVVRVSPLTWREFERGIERPRPPAQETELGVEENYAHPDYVQALAEYQAKLNEARFDGLIMLGIDTDVDAEAVTRLRQRAARLHITIDEDDLLAYVKHVCITSADDIERLQEALLNTSVPTEEAIAGAAEAYKSPVEGQ